MRILERLGLARKSGHRPRRVGLQARPVKRDEEPPLTREETLARVGIFGVLLLLTILAFPNRESYERIAQVLANDVWQGEEVIAPFKFPVFKSDEQLQAERDSVRVEEPPIFARVPEAATLTGAAVDSLEREIGGVAEAFASWRRSRLRGEPTGPDSVLFYDRLEAADVELTEGQWALLLDSYAQRTGATGATREVGGTPLHTQLLRITRQLANRLLPYGVLDVPKDSIRAGQITVANLEERTEGELRKEDVYGLDEAATFVENDLNVRFPNRPDTVALAQVFFRETLQPSLRFLRAESEARWREKEEGISRTVGMVQEGQAIVRRGDRITEEVQRQLYSLARIQAEQQGEVGALRIFLGEVLLATSAFLIFFLYLYLLRPQIYRETRLLLLISILFAAIVGFYGVAVRLPEAADLAVPVALASILLTVIFDSRVGMFATVTLAIVGGLVFGSDFEFTFATVFAGMLAVFSVRDIKNRSQIVLTAGLVFAAYIVILGSYTLLRSSPVDRFLNEAFLIGINSVLLLLAYPLLWVFERTFGVTTDLTLLELSDTNRPLLKELSLRAPGTFNHSLQVANLAEAAADAVDANALLARIGALYHDIGKMLKPEYYIENQQPGENPHDRVTPYMSALIIASHVKDGIELGRDPAYHLPQGVLDFIPTHHGTTLMEFFYRKAKELRGPDDPPVEESEFRYPGPRPQTNEQGIVMLADSVEAASRSLDKPTPKRLEGLVDAIFRARIEDGQLDDCELTFADLTKIKETFLGILSGIYHFRVKYPDQDRATGEGVEEGADTVEQGPRSPRERHPSLPPGLGSPTQPFFSAEGEPQPPPTAQDEPALPPAPGDGASDEPEAQGPSTGERASMG